ncbi:MAG: hypothetical protein IPL23_16255 [Saprospiraceae bacterium]|nr:hypothetical protein [Saprospiraceae bacterium]
MFNKYANVIFIALGIGGYFYFEVPNNLFAGCAAVYIILWKIVWNGDNLTGNYTNLKDFKAYDSKFSKALLNSEWYEQNKDNYLINEITINALLKQNFYEEYVIPMVKNLISNNFDDFSKGKITLENLLKLHATGIIHSMPNPLIKNKDGIISVGGQLIVNAFASLKTLNTLPGSLPEDYKLNINTTSLLIEKSYERFV